MFQSRVESFFSEYILSSDIPLGEICDYVIKIEFQERGAPHAHCLFWAKDAPQIDVDSDEDVCSFVDEYISERIPSSIDGISWARNNKMIQDVEGTMFTSTAKDFKKDVHSNVADVTFSTNPNETGNLLGVLQVKVGAHVMLTNVDVTDCLTNGAMGTVPHVVCTGNKIDVI